MWYNRLDILVYRLWWRRMLGWVITIMKHKSRSCILYSKEGLWSPWSKYLWYDNENQFWNNLHERLPLSINIFILLLFKECVVFLSNQIFSFIIHVWDWSMVGLNFAYFRIIVIRLFITSTINSVAIWLKETSARVWLQSILNWLVLIHHFHPTDLYIWVYWYVDLYDIYT